MHEKRKTSYEGQGKIREMFRWIDNIDESDIEFQ